MRRITSQILQIKNLILNTIGLGAPPSASQKAGLVRDAFGLHKIIIAVTGLGKVCCFFLFFIKFKMSLLDNNNMM